MKICDSCGTIGGGHTAFCKYQKRDPEMLDIHESHKMMKGGCLSCERSDVAGLVLECSGVPMWAAKPTFPVDSSHETKLIEGTWTCTFCSGTDPRVLKHACPRVPKSEVAINISHRITPKNGEPITCENCGAKTAEELQKFCVGKHSSPPMMPDRPIFPIDSSHQTEFYADGFWRCVFCKGVDELELSVPCKGGVVDGIHSSHIIGESGYCVNCAKHKTMNVYMRVSCPKAERVEPGMTGAEYIARQRRIKKFEVPKGTILLNDTVWMLYYWDHGPMIVSIHASAQKAVEANTENHSIGQWKLGTDFREAVKQWESRNEKKDES